MAAFEDQRSREDGQRTPQKNPKARRAVVAGRVVNCDAIDQDKQVIKRNEADMRVVMRRYR